MLKPQKAENCNLGLIRFPVVASVKIDGIWSGQMETGKFTARSLKPFKNGNVTRIFSNPQFAGFNGELALGSLVDGVTCRRTSSEVNSYSLNSSGQIPILYPFDLITEDTVHLGYSARFILLQERIRNLHPALRKYVQSLPRFKTCYTLEEVVEFHSENIALGYEGTILRYAGGVHKNGRSTLREGFFLRLKEWQSSEGEVLELIEAEENLNPALTNELGETYRTSHRENKIGKGMVGSFRLLWQGEEITISSGSLNHDERREIWETGGFIGKTVTFKFMPYGVKDKPRFAQFVSVREDL